MSNPLGQTPQPDGALDATSDEVPHPSAIRLVRSTPLYRGATIAMLLSGVATSAAAPQIASFLVTELHASLSVAGLYYLTSLTAPVAGYLIGRRSDRSGRRLNLFRVCATAGFVGWVGIALAPQLWIPFVLSAAFLGFAGAAASQLFAALHDALSLRPSPVDAGVVSIVRMALTAGWVIGPVLGTVVASVIGLRWMLFATAFCTLAQIIPLGVLRDAGALPRARPAPASAPARRGPGPTLPLLAFTGLYVLVYAGESVKYAFLPIYMNQELHLPAAVSGSVIGIQPLIELALMPVAALVARRTGMIPLMVAGAAFGVAANLFFALSGSAAGLYAGQILMGGVWGVFAALGIIVAQRLHPAAVATASAIFMSSTALSSALGGLAGSIGVATIGLPLVFLVPAVAALIAVAGLLVMSRTAGRGL